MIYFTADLHFGHKNILDFDNRPFTNIDIHDKVLIEKWNNKVSMNDEVYILGDISWHNVTKTIEIVKQLNSKSKHLIVGNHDSKLLKSRELQSLFVEIVDYKELSLPDGKGIILCHYPMPCFKNHYHGWYHLYGHIHNSFESNMMEHIKLEMEELYNIPCNMYNVGVMHWNYEPVSLEEILNDKV